MSWREIAFTLVRVIIGYILFMHGWAKITGPGHAGVSGMMAKILSPAVPLPARPFSRNSRCPVHHHRIVHAVFRGRDRDRNGHCFPCRPHEQGLRGGPGRIRICPPARSCLVCNRHPGRRPILGRSDDRQGAINCRHSTRRARFQSARARRIHTLLSWKAAPP